MSPRPMTQREIEKALEMKFDTYPGQTICAICQEFWFAHSGALCPKCAICGKHGLSHDQQPGHSYEVIEIRENYVWLICSGGTTTFLPQLECDA